MSLAGCRYGCDILSGLALLHARGVVMLDLKPQNVLLDDQNRAVLADFGLARVLREGATHASVSASYGCCLIFLVLVVHQVVCLLPVSSAVILVYAFTGGERRGWHVGLHGP
jgi:serine/threonine protein kinase